MSLAKQEVILEGYSPGKLLVTQFLETARAKSETSPPSFDPQSFFLDVGLVSLIKDHLYEGRNSEKLEKPGTLRKLAKDQGWHVGEKLVRVAEWGMRNQRAYVISLSKEVADTDPAALHRQGKDPLGVSETARPWLML